MIKSVPNKELVCHSLGGLLLFQPKNGYRFSIDSLLLSDFAPCVQGPVADLGTGSGIICVSLAKKGLKGPFTGLELDPVAAYCCLRNFEENKVNGRVFCHDLAQNHPEVEPNSFSMVISNPPFTPKGHGRVPPDPARAKARHELNIEPLKIFKTASRLLKPKGRFVFCWPPNRLVQAFQLLPQAKLMPKRLRISYGRMAKQASLVMIESVKCGKEQLTIEPPLIVYENGQEYTPEVKAIYDRLS